ncbi:MAG: AsmA family protein [Rhodobacterales bacterium]|nr:AsmA family protein [Rhodobacterales bacterium]MDX5391081.1 AsmA family protein [Rhodobacterales bacterium]MDX5490776.1 AsmA family protein [Rhodobacterales bacterium]
MAWLFRILGALVVMVVICAVALLMLPGDRIAQVAVDQIKAQTGRDVVLRGQTTVSYYPVLGVSTGAVEIANAEWSEAGPMLVADSLKLGVDLMSLINGDVRITGLEMINPQVLLEIGRDGRANWELGVDGVAPSGQPSGVSTALALSLDRALITGGQVQFTDHGSGARYQVDDLSLDLRWPQYRGTAQLALAARPQGAGLISLAGEIGNLAALIEGEGTTANLEAQADGGTLRYDGGFAMPLDLDGSLAVNLSDTGAFLAALGLPGIDLPPGLGRQASATANLRLTPAMDLSLRGLALTLDQNSLDGAVDVALGQDVPMINATLAAGLIDLSAAAAGGDPGGTDGGAADAGWSKAPIDASGLGLFNGRIDLTATGLRVAGLSFADASLTITVDRSRAVVVLNRLSGYSGGMSGQVVANNRNGLSVGGSLRATSVEMESLLNDLAGINRFTGKADTELEFLSSGNSLHAIMNGLSGKGSLSMERGTIKGIDLDSLMRQGLATGGTTVFDSLSASYTMENGNLFNSDLLLRLPVISASGEGRIGLGARDIDYLFTPRTASADSGGGVVIPVRIRGPWADPRIWPDMEKAIDLNLKAEKEEARQAVEDKIRDELNLPTNEGQSLEDAAKEKLETEILKGLGRLLR